LDRKRDKVPGRWRKLHNEELRDLFPSPRIVKIIKSRRMRWVGHVALIAEEGVGSLLLVAEPEVKKSVGRPRDRWA
jgi:hypothetical protein